MWLAASRVTLNISNPTWYCSCQRSYSFLCMAEAGAGSLFDRFTDRARNVIVLAREEAVRLNHDYIGPEHLLLGIVREGEGIGASALLSLGIGVHLDSVRAQVALISVLGREPSPAYIPFSPSMRAVLEESWRTVLQLGHNYVGTEHLLLALLHDEIVVQLLGRLGADREQVREQVLTIINGYMTSAPTVARPPSASTASVSPAIPAPNTEPAAAAASRLCRPRSCDPGHRPGKPRRPRTELAGRPDHRDTIFPALEGA